MAKEFYGYFDSTQGDERIYMSDEFAQAFRALRGTGVGGGLEVAAAGGMTVSVDYGTAMIHGYNYALSNDGGAYKILTLGKGGNTDRIDRIVLRLDLSASQRNIRLLVKEGTPAVSPKPPALTNTSLVKEISLCQVRVLAGAAAVTAANLTDERYDSAVCGILAPEALQLDRLDSRYSKVATQNNLTTTASGYALDARQGKVLNEAIGTKLAKANLANNLTTTASGYALDARQGRILNADIDAIETKIGSRSLRPTLLWEGNLNRGGTATVAGHTNYSLFLVRLVATNEATSFLLAARRNLSSPLYGTGGYVRGEIYTDMLLEMVQLSFVGNVMTYDVRSASGYVGMRSGTNPPRTITAIYGMY